LARQGAVQPVQALPVRACRYERIVRAAKAAAGVWLQDRREAVQRDGRSADRLSIDCLFDQWAVGEDVGQAAGPRLAAEALAPPDVADLDPPPDVAAARSERRAEHSAAMRDYS
jgi:hypothetical protein